MKKSKHVWSTFLLFVGTVVIISCGSNKSETAATDTKEEATKNEDAAAIVDKLTEDATDDNNTTSTSSTTAVLNSIPSGSQTQTAYDAIMTKEGITDAELMDFFLGFNKSSNPSGNSAVLTVQILPKASKDKVIEYAYNFPANEIREPRPVTVSSGTGNDEKFIEKYEELKPFLFTKSDLIPFDKFDGIYEAAIKKSGYKPEECYIDRISIKKESNGKMSYYIDVQSTKSNTAHKLYRIDKEGNLFDR